MLKNGASNEWRGAGGGRKGACFLLRDVFKVLVSGFFRIGHRHSLLYLRVSGVVFGLLIWFREVGGTVEVHVRWSVAAVGRYLPIAQGLCLPRGR